MLENIVEKRRGADNRPVVCAFSAGGDIGLGGGLAADGTKGTINHLYSHVFYVRIGPYACLLDYAIPSINRIRMVATWALVASAWGLRVVAVVPPMMPCSTHQAMACCA